MMLGLGFEAHGFCVPFSFFSFLACMGLRCSFCFLGPSFPFGPGYISHCLGCFF